MPVPLRYPPGVQPPNRGPLARGSRSSISKPGSSSSSQPVKQTLLEDIEVEDSGPPKWRTVLNRRADLGYPDFYPSRPGFNQPEDVLTEDNVKNGFSARAFVATSVSHLSFWSRVVLLMTGRELLDAWADTPASDEWRSEAAEPTWRRGLGQARGSFANYRVGPSTMTLWTC